jgi:thymidylate kinase
MHVELIGCTGAGKTTLARSLVAAGRTMGLDVVLGDDFVLDRIRLNWIRGSFLRRRLVEAFGVLCYLTCWRQYRSFAGFVIRSSCTAPGSWLYRANIARITLRKIGIHALIRRHHQGNQVILVDDEGVLQAAHNLFVHSHPGSSSNGLNGFATLAPLPDVVVYVRQPESVLIARTLSRGHGRIPDRSEGAVEPFVRRAVAVFEALHREPRIARRLVVIDGPSHTVASHAQPTDAAMVQALLLFSSAVQALAGP